MHACALARPRRAGLSSTAPARRAQLVAQDRPFTYDHVFKTADTHEDVYDACMRGLVWRSRAALHRGACVSPHGHLRR